MSFNIIKSSKTIADKYIRYLKTAFHIKDPEYKRIFEERLKESGAFRKGPYLDVTNSFAKGKSLEELIQEGLISSEFRKIKPLYNIPNLHYHQEEALRKAIKGNNLVVSTGTGSGKTECFLLPLINELMREKEEGTLDDGVRALIIYPMNALANDQIDRLRKMFIDYPDITFGCYTGQTKNHEKTTARGGKGAYDQYVELNGRRTDEPRLRKPLSNERISRDAMKERPPHILITNYAMLEYLMLRPEDNVFFDKKHAKKWKYIILDEAHTYSGSTGIEVSMLLRRLKASLDNDDIQFILTSATLGDESKNRDVVSFATRLCSADFKEENIIRAKRIDLKQECSKYDLGPSFYKKVESLIDDGYDDQKIISEIEEEHSFGIKEKTLSEYLYSLLMCDDTFWGIKNYLAEPRSVLDIEKYTGFDDDEISAFVEVASRASKNGSKLFDSRYHMFLRATEGVFITLAPHKDLFLTRKNVAYQGNEEYKVFEAVTCSQCHSLYLLGYVENGHLVQKSNAASDEIKEAYYVGEECQDTDEDTHDDSEQTVEKYELCPHCGFIRSTKNVHKSSCGHDESHFITVYKVKTTDQINGRVSKCVACENVNRLGILRGFFSGQEASTSVIGTSLFEELPSHEKRVIVPHIDQDDGFDIEEKETMEEVSKAKQFIAFSDSRQAAAYFASYFSISYDSFLYGRMIIDQMRSISKQSVPLSNFVSDLSATLEERKIMPFDDYLEREKNDESLRTYDYEKLAWKAILKELVQSSSRNSLFGMGLLSLDFNPDLVKFGKNAKYLLSEKEVKAICLVFVMGMLSDPAMHCPKQMTSADREFYTHNNVEFSYLLNDGAKYVHSFIPRKEGLSNKRLDYLTRVLMKNNPDISRDEVKKVLSAIWEHFFMKGIMFKTNESHYKVDLSKLILKKEYKVYKCSKCGKLTTSNVKGVCPSYHCDGELHEVDVKELEGNDHYYRLYNDLEIEPLRVVEHTAQLNREEAYRYQTLFKNQKIDVLSCSTTFEMGVDVGDLETVFMRNMPPSASNYAQRAGRAGRSTRSAAFALTFCNKSNHDFNYFKNPLEMIKGVIAPPQFKTDNEKICIRHLYSSAFSFFFKKYPEYFSMAKDFMSVSKDTDLCGYDVLKEFLTNDSRERDALGDYLLTSVPKSLHSKMGLYAFGWTKWLFGKDNDEYPSLSIVKDRYDSEIGVLKEEYEKAKGIGDPSQYGIKKRMKTYEEEPIISFLSRNNILPKYGFPVDTVGLELNIHTKEDDLSGLELTRDLAMAISEYAPGCEVVANNRLLTSRYIKTNPGHEWRKYDYIECENCKTMNVYVSGAPKKDDEHPSCVCEQCKNELNPNKIKTFLIPEFGFVAEEEVRKPSLIKPEKTYRTEATFFNYGNVIPETTYKVGGTEIKVSMVGNDGEMVMLNTTDFFVCPTCGYAIEKPANYGIFTKKMEHSHKNPNGYNCKSTTLERYSFGYKFKTDVIRFKICRPLTTFTNIFDEAYSILQALLLAACRILDVDIDEIGGCLQYRFENDGPNYSYILYDVTPGGAGNVKRLNNEAMLKTLLEEAYSIANNCTCAEDSSCYSCLRTYYNQKYHDIIRRNYVVDYIKAVLGDKR